MKKRTFDMLFACFVLMLFIISIGILHGRKKGSNAVTQTDQLLSQETLTTSDVLQYIQPYRETLSIESVARILKQFKFTLVLPVMNILLTENDLPYKEKVILIFSVAHNYQQSSKKEQTILDLLSLLINNQLINNNEPNKEPILYILAKSSERTSIPLCIAWLKKNKKDQQEQFMMQALLYAIEYDNFSALQTLISQGITVNKNQASLLLYYVVIYDADVNLIPFFLKRGADINFVMRSGYTILMEAVVHNNTQMVKALLEQGANPDILIDPKVGTAAQLAYEQKNVPLELLINEFPRR